MPDRLLKDRLIRKPRFLLFPSSASSFLLLLSFTVRREKKKRRERERERERKLRIENVRRNTFLSGYFEEGTNLVTAKGRGTRRYVFHREMRGARNEIENSIKHRPNLTQVPYSEHIPPSVRIRRTNRLAGKGNFTSLLGNSRWR